MFSNSSTSVSGTTSGIMIGAPREPQAKAELERLEKLIEELTISNANLTQRLQPILIVRAVGAGTLGQAGTPPLRAPLAETLNSLCERVFVLIHEQQNTLADIDL